MPPSSIPDEHWALHRWLLERMYSHERKTLSYIMEYMTTVYNFHPSKQSYSRKFDRWGLKKNIKGEQWKEVGFVLGKRGALEVDSITLPDGCEVGKKRLLKELARHYYTTSELHRRLAVPVPAYIADAKKLVVRASRSAGNGQSVGQCPSMAITTTGNASLKSRSLVVRTQPLRTIETTSLPFSEFQDLMTSALANTHFGPMETVEPLYDTVDAADHGESLFGEQAYLLSSCHWAPKPSIPVTKTRPITQGRTASSFVTWPDPTCGFDFNGPQLPRDLAHYILCDKLNYSRNIDYQLTDISYVTKVIGKSLIDPSTSILQETLLQLNASPSTNAIYQWLQYCFDLSANGHLTSRAKAKLLGWILDQNLFWLLLKMLRLPSLTSQVLINDMLLAAISLSDEGAFSKIFELSKSSGLLQDSVLVEALQEATRCGSFTIFKALVDTKTDLGIRRGRNSKTALGIAVRKDKAAPIIRLLLPTEVNKYHKRPKIHDGWYDCDCNLLSRAIKFACWEVIKVLLDAGFDVNWSCHGDRPLQAAVRGDLQELVLDLLERNADVNIPYRQQQSSVLEGTTETPLQIAVSHGKLNIVRDLLDAGADPNYHVALSYNSTPQNLCGPYEPPHESVLSLAIRTKKVSIIEAMIQAGADVNDKAAIESPLYSAVRAQDLRTVRQLLAIGAQVNRLSTSYDVEAGHFIGYTACQAAVRLNDMEILKVLLEAGADVNALPSPFKGRTTLQYAAANGNSDMVKFLLSKGANVNSPAAARDGFTALQAALINGDRTVIKLLLEAGAHVNAVPSRYKGTYTLTAAIQTGDLDIVSLLLDHGADINPSNESICSEALDDYPEAPLATAARDGNSDLVKLLLQRGAFTDPPKSHKHMYTPLQAAIVGSMSRAYCKEEQPTLHEYFAEAHTCLCITNTLLKAGADPNAQPNLGGRSVAPVPLCIALRSCNCTVRYKKYCSCRRMGLLYEHEMKPFDGVVAELLKAKANIDGVPTGCSKEDGIPKAPALIAAILSTDIDHVKLLLDAGADVDFGEESFNGVPSTPLAAAVYIQDDEMCELLLSRGAAVNESNNKGSQALLWAVTCGYIESCRMLLDRGANTKTRVLGDSPHGTFGISYYDVLGLAASLGYTEICQLLLEYGADPNFHDGTCRRFALAHAACAGYISIVRLLLEYGADINPVAWTGRSALDDAAQLGWTGRSALDEAALRGRTDIVHLLLEHDKELDKLDARCRRAAFLADDEHPAIARYLREYAPQRLRREGIYGDIQEVGHDEGVDSCTLVSCKTVTERPGGSGHPT